MFFDILTLFPSLFDSIFSDSIVKKAVEKDLISINIDDIRSYSTDPHRSVDDYPYGGAPGMVIKPEPLAEAIKSAKKRLDGKNPKVIFMTPRGIPLSHKIAKELSEEESLILLCGRYKGIDNRIREKYVDLEISLGDFVLSGGEIAAMAVVDSVMRFVPGVLGNSESASDDSFYDGVLSPPVYTRPEEFEGMVVPEVLLSGHHANIEKWQNEQAQVLTKKMRPDLLNKKSK